MKMHWSNILSVVLAALTRNVAAELLKFSRITASSGYGPLDNELNLVDGCKISKTWDYGCCFHTSKSLEKSEWIRFKFDEPHSINEVVIYNRVDRYKERLFPFVILVTDESGRARKCQGKSFNIGDPEIPTTATNPIRIECGNLRGNSVKLVGKVNEYINICEVEIFGQLADALNGYTGGSDGYLYKFHEERLTWDAARDVCVKEGASLAMEKTQATRSYIIQNYGSRPKHEEMWIGVTDKAKEGVFLFVDGTSVQKTYWGYGEPNNHGGHEDCVETNWGMIGKWNDRKCDIFRPFLCQKPAKDINECESNQNNCDANARCIPSKGSFSCVCHPGFIGTGQVCHDIDECSVNNGGCHPDAICTNTFGSSICDCKLGYSADGRTCTDINECESNHNDCDPNAHCSNTKGSFICECNSGFEGTGKICDHITATTLITTTTTTTGEICDNYFCNP